MRTKSSILLSIAFVGATLLAAVAGAQQAGGVSGDANLVVRAVSGDEESAKFQEYRDITDGLAGSLHLFFETSGHARFAISGEHIGLTDQRFMAEALVPGSLKLELSYDQIPHRFALGARTLYTGVGTGNLALSDRLQADLQASTSSSDAATRLKDYFTGASSVTFELVRRTTRVRLATATTGPFAADIEIAREERSGERSLGGSFGFGNPVEIPEPIDYVTTQPKVYLEHATKKNVFALTASYSKFENDTSTVSWDNPFRVTDSTAANAYTTSYAAGPSHGLIDLYPDNTAANVALTWTALDLPMRTRLSLGASLGRREQDDELVAYTTNTAISTGAVSGLAGITVPFDAWNRANLPVSSIDAAADTALYFAELASRPGDRWRFKASLRRYEYENKTKEIEFPGYVRFDAVWEPEPESNHLHTTGYTKTRGVLEAAFDLAAGTAISIGYSRDEIDRTRREVESSSEDTFKVTLDSKPATWFDGRLSLERSQRSGDYDYRVPFEGEEVTPQLPFLRKYDEANRDRDRATLILNFYPVEDLMLTGFAARTENDYTDSAFGLQADEYTTYAVDASYSAGERVDVFAFYNRERLESRQRSRQWSPGGNGDPYTRETEYDSPSNWTAAPEDVIDTIGAGIRLALVSGKLDLDLTYADADADGVITIASAVGGTTDSNNYVPLSFAEVDDSRTQTLDLKLRYRMRPGVQLSLGYLHEELSYDDLTTRGFAYVPTTATGAFNAALLAGTLWSGYDADVVYATVGVTF